MIPPCYDQVDSNVYSELLENIPPSDKTAISLTNLCEKGDAENSSCERCLQTIFRMLNLFDALEIENIDGDVRIKARSEIASYLFKSLSRYFMKNLSVVSNWEREGAGDELPPSETFDKGAQFVYWMERYRTRSGDLHPIRNLDVSVVLIKVNVKGFDEPLYLNVWDDKARQYQLLGGKRRSDDGDAFETIKREIKEELEPNNLIYENGDYNIVELVPSLIKYDLSRTYGAYTKYNMTIYHAVINRDTLILTDRIHRWLTWEEVVEGETYDGYKTSGQFMVEVEKILQDGTGLSNLGFSLKEEQVGFVSPKKDFNIQEIQERLEHKNEELDTVRLELEAARKLLSSRENEFGEHDRLRARFVSKLNLTQWLAYVSSIIIILLTAQIFWPDWSSTVQQFAATIAITVAATGLVGYIYRNFFLK